MHSWCYRRCYKCPYYQHSASLSSVLSSVSKPAVFSDQLSLLILSGRIKIHLRVHIDRVILDAANSGDVICCMQFQCCEQNVWHTWFMPAEAVGLVLCAIDDTLISVF